MGFSLHLLLAVLHAKNPVKILYRDLEEEISSSWQPQEISQRRKNLCLVLISKVLITETEKAPEQRARSVRYSFGQHSMQWSSCWREVTQLRTYMCVCVCDYTGANLVLEDSDF